MVAGSCANSPLLSTSYLETSVSRLRSFSPPLVETVRSLYLVPHSWRLSNIAFRQSLTEKHTVKPRQRQQDDDDAALSSLAVTVNQLLRNLGFTVQQLLTALSGNRKSFFRTLTPFPTRQS